MGEPLAGDERRVGVRTAHGDLAGVLDARGGSGAPRAQQRSLKIHGLCEIVVRPGVKAGAHIVKGVLYRYHQHRRRVARFAQTSRMSP